MSIAKKPPQPAGAPTPGADLDEARALAFIQAAPDGGGKPKTGKLAKRNKTTISLGVDPDLLEAIDEIAAEDHKSRAAMFNDTMLKMVRKRRPNWPNA